MKKIFKLFVVTLLVLLVTGCKNQSALDFKEEYESLNGKENSSGKIHRTITIAEDNPYEKVDPSVIVDKINNKETFYLYVGDSLCPWCRSVLEKSIEVAKTNKIKKIYYIKIWDEKGNEIFRDTYELKEGTPSLKSEGTKEYKTIIEKFDSVLSDYTLTNEAGEKVNVGEKRIYAPNFFYVENGEVKKMVEGISESQEGSRDELTDAMLEDEQKQFNELFNN